jgi:hypothetical protein
MSQDEAFKAWWYSEGSQPPYTHHDCEEHRMRMCKIAWANGAYKAIAELESQEPVAYYHPHKGFYWAKPTSISAPTAVDVEPLPLYTRPPQRTWVGLTKEDKDLIEDLCEMMIGDAAFSTIDAILKGKNT